MKTTVPTRAIIPLSAFAFLVAVTLGSATFAQSAHVLDGVGPGDQAMGGATTALPVDAIGATHRNAASITALPCSEVGFGFAVFAPSTKLNSNIPGMGSGSTNSDTDISPMPSMGFVRRSDDSRWAYGMGGFAVGGFGVDFPTTTLPDNPIISDQLFGGIYSSFQMMQITTPIAYRVTDRLSVGAAPVFSWASLAVTPFPAAMPDPPNSTAYPNGARTDAEWGLGFQLGVYWEDPDTGIHLAASYSSTQWLNEFKINSNYSTGAPRQLQFDLDYPAIMSFGAAYTGFERVDLSTDVRYIDYKNTDGFQKPAGYLAGTTPVVEGFGWDSIWVLAMGVQYHWCEHLRLRAGYTFNESPIGSDMMFFNMASPAIVQHHLSAGFEWDTPAGWVFSFAYHHGFQNSVAGPAIGPFPPGSTVGADLQTHTMVGSVAKRF